MKIKQKRDSKKKIKDKIPEVKVSIPDTQSPVVIPSIKDPTLIYAATRSMGRGSFQIAEYDLVELGKIEDCESFVRQAMNKKTALMFKEGWDIVGPNLRTITYIRARFAQIEQASGIATQTLFRFLGSSLIRKSNAFLIKVRKASASGGRVRTLPGTNMVVEPVAAYFTAPAETMEYQLSGNKIAKWRQKMPDGNFKEWNPRDVIHFFHDRKDGFIFGTPLLVPVIDDIRALRKIEENIELLVYQHLFPLFQYKVGTNEAPAGFTEDGRKEIDVVRQEIQYMPTEGGIVTPDRHDIKAIGSEGRALRAEGYLEYFKKRVIAGLGISSVDLGEGSCYSDDTETLTESGWKFHKDINHLKEKIATFNPETKEIEFCLPNFKYEGYYEGQVVCIKGQHLDIKVTPHHTMWIRPRKDKTWKTVEAQDLLTSCPSEFYLLESAPFKEPDNPSEVFEIPDVKAKRGVPGGFCQGIQCSITDFAEFLGYYLSEGCLDLSNGERGVYRTIISQNKGKDLETICKNADRLSLSYSKINRKNRDKESGIRIYSKALYSYLKKTIPCYARNKLIPDYVWTWSKEARIALFNALILGDGTEQDTESFKTYYTSSKKLADGMQMLSLSLGFNAKIVYFSADPTNSAENPMWRVYISEPRVKEEQHRLVSSNMVSSESYVGGIYCYNVPSHLFVTRRNGKVTIQGNTVNRSTSDNLSRNLVDSVKDYQQVFEAFFNTYILSELLLESTFGDSVLDSDNLCQLRFKEIDIDIQVKKENHYADQFNKNVITLAETRRFGFGLEPIRIPTQEDMEAEVDTSIEYPEWHNTHWKLYEEPKLLISASDEPYSALAKALAKNPATAPTPSDTKSAAEEQIAHEMELEKQKGKTAIAVAKAKPKPVAKKKDGYLSIAYDTMTKDMIAYIQIKGQLEYNWIGQLIRTQMETTIGRLISDQIQAFKNGYILAGGKTNINYAEKVAMARNLFTERANFYVTKLTNDIIGLLKRKMDSESNILTETRAIFDSLRYRTDFIEDVETGKALNWGRCLAWKEKGHTTVLANEVQNSCVACNLHTKDTYYLNLLSIEDIPPYHAGCKCFLSPNQMSVQDMLQSVEDTKSKMIKPQSKRAKFNKCIIKTKARLKSQHPEWSEEEVEMQAETACDHTLQDEQKEVEDGVKLEHCVKKVKTRIRVEHPDWDEDKVKSSAFAICQSSLKG